MGPQASPQALGSWGGGYAFQLRCPWACLLHSGLRCGPAGSQVGTLGLHGQETGWDQSFVFAPVA